MNKRFSLLAVLLCVVCAPVHAAEKIAGTAEKTPKGEKADWVDRCDRLAETKRFDCLEKLRAEAQARFLEQEAQKKAAPEPKAGAADK